jgi:hypothetical protein
MTVLVNEQPPVWSTYLDLEADVQPYVNLTNVTGSNVMSQLMLSMDFACTWVQNYIQRPVAPTEVTEYLDGWTGLDGSYLMVKWFPIIPGSVSVNEYWGTNGSHVLAEQSPTNQSAQDSFQVDYLAGRIIRSFPGLTPRPFFPGSRNVVITYTAGYETVPMDIKVATLAMTKYWFRHEFDPRQSSKNSYGEDSGSDLFPGIPNRVAELLAPYKAVIIV